MYMYVSRHIYIYIYLRCFREIIVRKFSVMCPRLPNLANTPSLNFSLQHLIPYAPNTGHGVPNQEQSPSGASCYVLTRCLFCLTAMWVEIKQTLLIPQLIATFLLSFRHLMEEQLCQMSNNLDI